MSKPYFNKWIKCKRCPKDNCKNVWQQDIILMEKNTYVFDCEDGTTLLWDSTNEDYFEIDPPCTVIDKYFNLRININEEYGTEYFKFRKLLNLINFIVKEYADKLSLEDTIKLLALKNKINKKETKNA